jgi:hypothetical protein
MQTVRWKLYRVKQHYDELRRELTAYYQTAPGSLARKEGTWTFESIEPIPARLGLICGDVLQCIRSSLDYLVWELVLAEGNVPNKQNMFPIALTLGDYKNEVVKRHRLDGISATALAHIEACQPYLVGDPSHHPLAILDELTNINKHRRVLFTYLSSAITEPTVSFPYISRTVHGYDAEGKIVETVPLWTYVTIDEGGAKGTEITTCLDDLAIFVGDKLLPLFDVILERA